MFVHYRTQGIILKKVDRREADQLFTVYTKDFGKLEILGKAIRKISSKLRSGMKDFYLSEIEFIQGKAYKTLTDAVLIEKFEHIRKDLEKTTIATKISEVLDDLIGGQESDERIWNLLLETFRGLNKKDLINVYNPKLIYFYFFWNFLCLLGYCPELYKCAVCQKKLKPEKLYFSKKDGGIICQDCFLKEKSLVEIDADVVKIMRFILAKDIQIVTRLKVKNTYLKCLEEISEIYLSFISEHVK